MSSLALTVGARVSALYEGDQKYYDAIVRSVLPGGRCTVTFVGYENDDPQETSPENVRPRRELKSITNNTRFAAWEDKMQRMEDAWDRKGAKASRSSCGDW
jgi:hypothetical protein